MGVDPNKVEPDEIDPNEVGPNEIDPNEVNLDEVDPDAVLSIAAAAFMSSIEAPVLRSSKLHRSLTNGPNVALHDCRAAVLDVVIGLRINPLQLVVATNNQISCNTLVKRLTTICSTPKKLSNNNVFIPIVSKCKLTRGVT